METYDYKTILLELTKLKINYKVKFQGEIIEIDIIEEFLSNDILYSLVKLGFEIYDNEFYIKCKND